MTNSNPSISPLDSLVSLAIQIFSKQDTESTGNPVLVLTQKIHNRLKTGRLSFEQLQEIIQNLRDSAFLSHAQHLHDYVDGTEEQIIADRLDSISKRIIEKAQISKKTKDSFQCFKNMVESKRFAAVFTAHPTFALANSVYTALANMATNPIANKKDIPFFTSHRRNAPPTLNEELQLAIEAIERGRNALDLLNRHIYLNARKHWPDQWTNLYPQPIILSSWVGYDTDGRTDIGWWDSLRIRLQMKALQLKRLQDQLSPIYHGADELKNKITLALNAVRKQQEACPTAPDPDKFSAFSRILIEGREEAIHNPEMLTPLFDQALQNIPENNKIDLLIAKAGFFAHGMSLAHTHVRLNSVQVHNMARQRLGIVSNPENPSHSRTLFNTINEALYEVKPVPVDFGSLLMEQASASTLMMMLTQITKHIDSSTPIRFLIAETESGYTLLVALWLARLFDIEDFVEISPLFETDEALRHGANIIEQALRSPHWRNYLRKIGKLCLQFGYSDSGRFIGQIAATYLIEKLRNKIVNLLKKYDLVDVQLVLFDTHGESIGRGGHPFRLDDRLKYLSPRATELHLSHAGIQTRQETAFQGGDGYLLFGSQALANATISIIANHIFDFSENIEDPIYHAMDFNADFFSSIVESMTALVDDKGYGALLSVFGPGLIDRTGSRPAIRQSDTTATSARIRHPRELRAIPNNAILQQLGWYANVLQGLGTAATAHPDMFEEMLQNSPRFKRSLDFVYHALKHSNASVLRAIIYMLDPGFWLDRAALEKDSNTQESYIALSQGLKRLNVWSSTQAMFHQLQKDHIALLSVWEKAPNMEIEEILLHALRLVLIEEIWMLSTKIPYFSPRHDFTREALDTAVLSLEIPTALDLLLKVFPQAPDHVLDLYFYETKGPRHEGAYAMDDREIFQPIRKNFNLLREISIALIHKSHAFG